MINRGNYCSHAQSFNKAGQYKNIIIIMLLLDSHNNICAQNSDSKCSHDENDGQKNQEIDKQEANSNSESDKGTKPKHLCSDIDSESEVSVCMDIALHYSDKDHCV